MQNLLLNRIKSERHHGCIEIVGDIFFFCETSIFKRTYIGYDFVSDVGCGSSRNLYTEQLVDCFCDFAVYESIIKTFSLVSTSHIGRNPRRHEKVKRVFRYPDCNRAVFHICFSFRFETFSGILFINMLVSFIDKKDYLIYCHPPSFTFQPLKNTKSLFITIFSILTLRMELCMGL